MSIANGEQTGVSETPLPGERFELPLLPLKETVVFPDSMMPLAVGQERSVKLVDDIVSGEGHVALIAVREVGVEEPGWDDIYSVGVEAAISRMLKMPDGTLRLLVQGVRRIRLLEPVRDRPYLVGRFEEAPDVIDVSDEIEALTRNVQSQFARVIQMEPYLPDELAIALANVDDPGLLSYLVASNLRRLTVAERQQLLEQASIAERLRSLSRILAREVDVGELESKIQTQVQSELDQSQREFILRQQLKAIQEELGEVNPEQAEMAELRERVEAADLPEEARRAADRELGRLERLPSAAAEYGVIRTYLEWIVSLPWKAESEDHLDLERAKQILDEDHYDLEKVKERIIEYLAVSKLKGDVSGPILCFVGPPGVGKTSLGQSIARALGRKLVRISVGGVRDEAEIRGHRRTYIGAMPGTVIRALRDAETRNPVFLIDEIDKMGMDYRGDPASAMLEVLDPEQHSSFRDHYLDLPFDLSRVLFICTANQAETIPPPLLDRMDTIRLSGYTEEEKLGIARRYLAPKQIEAHGLGDKQVVFTDEALRLVISEYTREAGVRNLERQLAALCRKAARQIAEGKKRKISLGGKEVREWLGPRRFAGEVRRRTAEAGVATGLAWTPVGGEILFIEATAYEGSGRLTLTGQLGDVMQESAQAALSYARAHASELGIENGWFTSHDLHLHVPSGAVPKDGPSAGITMATAIVSLATQRPVAGDLAMTGEITITGQVLPIGGLREKLLAAQRAEIKRVIVPRENEPDLEDLPEETRQALQLILVDGVGEVLETALAAKSAPGPGSVTRIEREAASAEPFAARRRKDKKQGTV
ncbi:MAG: endopeptidase La [Gaiellaceae bacterium]